MITKERASQLLNEYLELEYNLDPLYSESQYSKSSSIFESDTFWRIGVKYVDKTNGSEIDELPIGGGVFFIAKKNGLIYEKGSIALFDWEVEFAKFQNTGESKNSWAHKKVSYLECESLLINEISFEKRIIESKINERDIVVKNYITMNEVQVSNNINPFVKIKAVEGDVAEIEIAVTGEISEDEIETVKRRFKGGIGNYIKALRDIKKWNRVYNLKGSDDFWIEVEERNFEKDVEDWKLCLNMNLKK